MQKVRNIPSTQMSALRPLPPSLTADKENLCSDLSQNRFILPLYQWNHIFTSVSGFFQAHYVCVPSVLTPL